MKFRVALPAADPPDNASDYRYSSGGPIDSSSKSMSRRGRFARTSVLPSIGPFPDLMASLLFSINHEDGTCIKNPDPEAQYPRADSLTP